MASTFHKDHPAAEFERTNPPPHSAAPTTHHDPSPTSMHPEQHARGTGPGAFGQAFSPSGQTVEGHLPDDISSRMNQEATQQHPIVHPQPHKAVGQHQTHKGPTGGVGSLPGTPNEEGVAILPEERAQEKAKEHPLRNEAAPTINKQGMFEDSGKTTGAALPTPGSKGEAALFPEHKLHKDDEPIAGGHSQPFDRDREHGHKFDEASTHKPAAAGTGTHPTHPTGIHPTGPHATGTDPHGTHGEKQHVPMMDKLKGEAKVLQGKVTGNEEKVQEGERIKGNVY